MTDEIFAKIRLIEARLEFLEKKLSEPSSAAASWRNPNGDNGGEKFPAETLVATVDQGKVYWKVQGGRYRKFGISVWPEVLDVYFPHLIPLDPLKTYNLRGYTACVDDSGEHKKVVVFLDEQEEREARKPAPAHPAAQNAPATKPAAPTNGDRAARELFRPKPQKNTHDYWLKEAMNCTEELMFDTALARAEPWFKSGNNVAEFRRLLFGEWDPGAAPAVAESLVKYADVRRQNETMAAGEAHNLAKAEALEVVAG